MRRKAQKLRTKSMSGWTADDELLAKLKLEQWEGRVHIALGKDWRDEFATRVRQRFSSHEGFPGGPPGGRAASGDWVCKDRLRERTTHLSEKIQRLFEICGKILEERGQGKTPEILRRICDGTILPLLELESRAIWEEIDEYYPTDLRSELKNRKTALTDDISRIEKKWRKRIDNEVLAAEIELLESRKQVQLSPSEKNTISVSPGTRSRLSYRDEQLFQMIEEDNFRHLTNEEIARRYRSEIRKLFKKSPTADALRACLNRIRRHHSLPRSEEIPKKAVNP